VRATYVGGLLRAPVRLRGIQLGRPVDVIFDRELRRALGFEIHCGDDVRRFLPFSVASYDGDALEIPSSLVLLDAHELRFYTERGATFASLRDGTVHRDGRPLGLLGDAKLTANGTIEELVVRTASGTIIVPYDANVAVAAARVRAAS
jgi:hypothetical protein